MMPMSGRPIIESMFDTASSRQFQLFTELHPNRVRGRPNCASLRSLCAGGHVANVRQGARSPLSRRSPVSVAAVGARCCHGRPRNGRRIVGTSLLVWRVDRRSPAPGAARGGSATLALALCYCLYRSRDQLWPIGARRLLTAQFVLEAAAAAVLRIGQKPLTDAPQCSRIGYFVPAVHRSCCSPLSTRLPRTASTANQPPVADAVSSSNSRRVCRFYRQFFFFRTRLVISVIEPRSRPAARAPSQLYSEPRPRTLHRRRIANNALPFPVFSPIGFRQRQRQTRRPLLFALVESSQPVGVLRVSPQLCPAAQWPKSTTPSSTW